MISNSVDKRVSLGSVLSFAIIVLGVFLSIFTSGIEFSILGIVLLIIAGIGYIFMGIYIFSISYGYPLAWLRALYMSVQLSLACAIILMAKGTGASLLIFIPLIGQSVILFSPRAMLIINGMILIGYAALNRMFSVSWETTLNSLPLFLAGQVFVILFMQMHQEEEIAHRKITKLISDLESANKSLKEYSERVESLTLVRERNRLAREIHDGLGHYLTVIHMQIQAARAVFKTDPDKSFDTLKIAQKQAQEALVDVRRSVGALREPGEYYWTPLIHRIEQLAKASTTSGLMIETQLIGVCITASPAIELALYRIIQEGIQNCIKHSQANHLWIRLDYSQANWIRLSIKDNGLGSKKTNGGYGLIGIQERVTSLGGKLDLYNDKKDGFNIDIEVPL